ncbi:MAG: DNA primase regulatory subunit PriL [Methanosarcinales archaeon]|nr:DNA primase regulatory subunit PriL [Methanosarcinales archaeon]
MDVAKLSYYPFLTQAAAYVAQMDSSIDDIIKSKAYGMPRSRARSRVIQSITGAIEEDSNKPDVVELLSYPIARILVSCIDDAFLTRRYALAEAKFANTRMQKEDDYETLLEIGGDFNINASIAEKGFRIHFTDYIRGAAGMRALGWKLVNRRLRSGYVNITKEEYTRLLQEGIRIRIFNSLPLAVPESFCLALKEYLVEVRTCLEQSKKELGEEGFGEMEPGSFPPCIKHLLAGAQGGVNLAHSARFALTSFLLNIGLSVDQIIQLFGVSPDFKEEMTRYQVEHIAGGTGTSYKPPSCSTMITYGNCMGKDILCREIGHPLSYYTKKKKREAIETGGKADGGQSASINEQSIPTDGSSSPDEQSVPSDGSSFPDEQSIPSDESSSPNEPTVPSCE